MKKDLQERERVLASYNQKEIDNPMILPAGEYKEKQKHLQQQWRDECRDYYLGVMSWCNVWVGADTNMYEYKTRVYTNMYYRSTKSGLTLIFASTKLLTL